MAITSILRDWADGVSLVRIVTTSTLSQVGTTGYVLAQDANITALNNGAFTWVVSDMALVYASDGWGFFTISSDFESLDAFVFVPGVTTPTIVGHIAVYDSTNGNLSEDAATAINGGNIQAGLSGTAGYLASFPGTAAKGSLRLVAANNAGNTVTQLTNASFGQATVITVPDPVSATANMLLAPAALVSGNVVSASGTAGLIIDSGAPITGLNKVASVAITAAEWNGMYAAPKLLIAAPGANNLIIVDKVVLIMTFVSAAYAAGGVVGFQYDSTVHGAGVAATNVEAAADFFAAASTSFQFNGVAGNTVAIAPFTTSVNKGLYISNLTGAFTTGDSTWVAKIYYRIVAVA